MSGWNDTAPAGSDEWTSGEGGATAWNDGGNTNTFGDDFKSFTPAGNDFSGNTGAAFDGLGDTNGGYGGGGDNACHNCGQEGHMARECPEPRKPMGACFNCGEEGHSKAECPNPRVFTGTCRICEKQGHRAEDCPDKPPPICNNCRKEGHEAKDCKDQREFDLNHIPDKTVDEALALLKAASEDRDLDDFKEAFKIYTKADRTLTYEQAEKTFRKMDLNVYLIALNREPGTTFTNIDLQGNLDREYAVGFFLSPKAQRPKIKERWPTSIEENFERLQNAGLPMDRGVPMCICCGELGHMSRQCTEEPGMIDRVEVKCVNCDQPGHRVRDCPNERTFGKPRAPRECKICSSTEHLAKDCDQRQVMKCRNCDQEGHKAADCSEPRAPRDPSEIQCRNCDQFGHVSRECAKPRDYSRVTCTNCGEKGHTRVRCKQPINDENAGDGGPGGGSGVNNDATTNGGPKHDTPAAVGGWTEGPAIIEPVTFGGGGW